MNPTEYLEVKRRMLLASELLNLVVTQQDPIRFDEEYYPLIFNSATANKGDVTALFAYIDILRSRLGEPLLPIDTEVADADSGGHSRDDEGGAESDTDQQEVVHSEEAVADATEAKQPVQRRRKRSNSSGNTRSRKRNTKKLESAD
jgi:hypothetical protein